MKLKHLLLFIIPALLLSSCNDEDEKSLPFQPNLEEEILSEINQYRTDSGLTELKMDGFLRDLAREHSENMGLKGAIDHEGFKARAEDIRSELGNGSIAENVAAGGDDAKSIVQLWLDSKEGHRENIEGNYDLTGIGAVKDEDGRHYYTQIFFDEP
jgi:uncharacterized protein YkwD